MQIMIVRYRHSGVIDTAQIRTNTSTKDSDEYEVLSVISTSNVIDPDDLLGIVRQAFTQGVRYGEDRLRAAHQSFNDVLLAELEAADPDQPEPKLDQTAEYQTIS